MSMTGYGRAQELIDGRDITVELRSVNNRYLDCTVKLPRLYNFAEETIKSKVQGVISRGKVEVYVSLGGAKADNVKISLNRPVLEGYLAAAKQMSQEYGLLDNLGVAEAARLPDVFVIEKQEEDADAVAADICRVVDDALEQFGQMRSMEGGALEADIRGRVATVLSIVERIEARSPVTLSEYRRRLEQKLHDILEGRDVEEGRLLTEVALFADKIAVDEETVRLRSHITQLLKMLDEGGIIGRKLDFLLQELNREANTIGSKGNDPEQAKNVVALKAELEKIREQAQNIE